MILLGDNSFGWFKETNVFWTLQMMTLTPQSRWPNLISGFKRLRIVDIMLQNSPYNIGKTSMSSSCLCGRQLAEFATHVLFCLIWFQTLISISSRHSLWICYIITPRPRENSISFCSGLCCVYCLPACIRESCLASILARLCTICTCDLFFPSKLGPLNINTSYQSIYSASPS